MKETRTLFIQGAGEGAYDEDSALADFLRSLEDDPGDLAYPKIEGLEMIDWAKTRKELSDALADLVDGGCVVAHSLGGAAILKLLSEQPDAARIGGLFLVATPYKVTDGEWGTDEFAIDLDFAGRLPDCGTIRLYHSRDDEFVPVDHIDRYGEKLPGAVASVLNGYGHQFSSKPFRELAEDIEKMRARAG